MLFISNGYFLVNPSRCPGFSHTGKALACASLLSFLSCVGGMGGSVVSAVSVDNFVHGAAPADYVEDQASVEVLCVESCIATKVPPQFNKR